MEIYLHISLILPAAIIPCATPQQRNGSDCGVYVLAITEHLAKVIFSNFVKVLHLFSILQIESGFTPEPVTKAVTHNTVTELRVQIKNQIKSTQFKNVGPLFSLSKKKKTAQPTAPQENPQSTSNSTNNTS